MAKLSDILRERGYVYQQSAETLEEITDGEKRTVYLGVDPTADSIHLGNFAQYMFLRRFAEAGHKVILIIGGGTALAGDPKPDVERELTDASVVAARAEKLKSQAKKILGDVELELVNNADWLTKLNLMEFLRETGKYFTVNNLVKKDAINARMESEGGISFTEFSYPLLQAYDFWHLYKTYGCNVQIGGSDQWGNIIAGVDLIRKKEGGEAFALSSPLIIEKSTGKKFGKSEGNAIWLDAEKTSPFAFYQFFFNVEDAMVEELLFKMTLLSKTDIDNVLQNTNPGDRLGQRTLAENVTSIVHGAEAAHAAARISSVLFGSGIAELSQEEIDLLKKEAPTYVVTQYLNPIDVVVGAGLASSKTEARNFINAGSVTLDGVVVAGSSNLANMIEKTGGIGVMKRGKRNVCVLTLS